MTICDWCGHDHPVTALCTQRPKWSRRGFLALLGAAAVGAAVPPALVPEPLNFIRLGGATWTVEEMALTPGDTQLFLATLTVRVAE